MSQRLVAKGEKPALVVDDAFLPGAVGERLSAGKRVRRTLPCGGRLHIDRQLPFLFVYRHPDGADDVGTAQLVKSEAAYLHGSFTKGHARQFTKLVDNVVATLSPEFGAFLIIELWSGSDKGRETDHRAPEVSPRFRIVAPTASEMSRVVDVLSAELKRIRILKQRVDVEVIRTGRIAPPDMKPILSKNRAAELDCTLIGIELPPVWRDVDKDQNFPLLLRTLGRRLSKAFRKATFEFVKRRTTSSPPHYHALGRRAVVKAVWEVDAQLASVGRKFEFLLQVTPINTDAAWQQFRRANYESVPDFHYLPTPMDPGDLKRQLFDVPIRRIEDPALHNLFREKRDELDRKITMLRDRNTPSFLYGSLQLFGPVDAELFKEANELLTLTADTRKDEPSRGSLDAEAFAFRARKEFDTYKAIYPGFKARVEITPRVSGIMVSSGKLLINPNLKTPRGRIEALIQHEVGTHLLTYYNGMHQPFQQLASGLAGYDEFQEGLAVLAEYLVGGLSVPRVRQLAGRVIAAKMLVDGASFVETFRQLAVEHGFAKRSAYTITMRVYRGGGLTKDAVYLRGLIAILKYLGDGGDIGLLFVGKMAKPHVVIVEELLFRKVLKEAPLRPTYLQNEAAMQRLARVSDGVSVTDLLEAPTKITRRLKGKMPLGPDSMVKQAQDLRLEGNAEPTPR